MPEEWRNREPSGNGSKQKCNKGRPGGPSGNAAELHSNPLLNGVGFKRITVDERKEQQHQVKTHQEKKEVEDRIREHSAGKIAVERECDQFQLQDGSPTESGADLLKYHGPKEQDNQHQEKKPPFPL